MPHIVLVASSLVRELERSFDEGPIVDAAGSRMINEEQIGRFAGLSVLIYAGEHPPPHFHVKHNQENVPFALDSGRRLSGAKGLDRYDRNIAKWWRDNRCELISSWNRLRPSDCPVGPVAVPPECATEED